MQALESFLSSTFTPLHFLCIQCLHLVHAMEFEFSSPTPNPHTPQGKFEVLFTLPLPYSLHMTLVLPIFTLSPFFSISFFQFAILRLSSSSLSAINTRSSAYSNSHGNPSAAFLVTACITVINRNGLSTDPWCTPTLTSNSSLKPCSTLTAVFASWYVVITALIIHSLTPSLRSAHSTTFLGTLSKAFSRSTNPRYILLFLPRYFS